MVRHLAPDSLPARYAYELEDLLLTGIFSTQTVSREKSFTDRSLKRAVSLFSLFAITDC